MFCNTCGKEINDKAVVCVHCGCKVVSAESVEAETASAIKKLKIAPQLSIWTGEGRIGRVEFLKWYLLTLIVSIIAIPLSFLILPFLLFVPVMWISITSTIKRLHDMSLSGWWILAIIFVSIITFGIGAFVVLILFLVIPGKDGENQYGESANPQKIF